MISAYRLGDLYTFGYRIGNETINDIVNKHANSIGAEYALANKGLIHKRIDIMTSIVLRHIQKYSHLLPKDIETSTVIHVRLGDVVAGNEYHEKCKRPLTVEYLREIVPVGKTYIIGKCFFAAPSSTNYDECIENSNRYLENVMSQLNAEHFDGGDADIDLCCAVKSKCFIQGKGYFSKLIVELRKTLNTILRLQLENIETVAEDTSISPNT